MTTLQSKKKLKDILGDGYVCVDVTYLTIQDNMDDACAAEVTLSTGLQIKGSGVGQVDAVFSALKSHYVLEYKSLETISLFDFNVKVDKMKLESTATICNVNLWTKNHYGTVRLFSDASRSLAASTARVSSQVAEFYINSERAYTALTVALRDASDRGRDDLVTRYTRELAEVVKATDYSGRLKL